MMNKILIAFALFAYIATIHAGQYSGCKDDPNGAVSPRSGSKFTCDKKDMCMHDWFTNACCKTCHKGPLKKKGEKCGKKLEAGKWYKQYCKDGLMCDMPLTILSGNCVEFVCKNEYGDWCNSQKSQCNIDWMKTGCQKACGGC